jgi:hypothetical protein
MSAISLGTISSAKHVSIAERGLAFFSTDRWRIAQMADRNKPLA